VVLTLRAVSVGRHAEEPYRSLVALLIECPADERGRAAARQERGATYGQLGRIAHDAGMTRGGRYRWYELACSIPLSEKHASHIIGRMGERRATWSSGSTSSGADAGSCARFRAEGAAGAGGQLFLRPPAEVAASRRGQPTPRPSAPSAWTETARSRDPSFRPHCCRGVISGARAGRTRARRPRRAAGGAGGGARNAHRARRGAEPRPTTEGV
jgi:hypothetical protein